MTICLVLILLSITFSLHVGSPSNSTINHAFSLFGPGYNGTAVEGKLVLSDPYSTCGNVSRTIRNKIVLVEKPRRERHCDYADLVYSMQLQGAIAVIVADYEKRSFLEFMKSKKHNVVDEIFIPSVFIEKSSANTLISLLTINSDLIVTINDEGEVFHLKLFIIRIIASIYVVILLLLWITTIVFYSDCCIVRRTLSHRSQSCKQLKQYIYKPDDMKMKECSICLEPFRKDDLVKVTPCNHSFHSKCIDPWLTKHSTLCPVCRLCVFEMDGSSETVLLKEIHRQQCVFSFWSNFLIVNFVLCLLILYYV